MCPARLDSCDSLRVSVGWHWAIGLVLLVHGEGVLTSLLNDSGITGRPCVSTTIRIEFGIIPCTVDSHRHLLSSEIIRISLELSVLPSIDSSCLMSAHNDYSSLLHSRLLCELLGLAAQDLVTEAQDLLRDHRFEASE